MALTVVVFTVKTISPGAGFSRESVSAARNAVVDIPPED
jgi:hypothetical protein